MSEEAMASVLASRDQEARIFGVFDQVNKQDTAIDVGRLGEAIHFIANASILGYDVRSAVVIYGEPQSTSLRLGQCEQLWARYGQSLMVPVCESSRPGRE
ncbi:hypothetical protein [Mesorhizobium sp. B1-1-8]|uniref:hypothetical protein n=1 Tax=Mesorhizobium sp. B1-1-8 TaxID=2589976 RepID=UPI001D01DF4A|nr:hypothetical protein [Mesorhizobium sp. B1-1-8]UCI10679.1 hypothetical protein FJ974_28320 [Mesorhizobium sp. B1-1-8]